MDKKLIAKLLTTMLKTKGQAEISVTGTSMQPTLFEGDKVIIKKCDEYKIGDILIFNYKNEGILIHRLLKLNNRYFCKGDNAFRLEDIEHDQIIGKAVLVNNEPICQWDDWKLNLSYLVNREFVKCHYDSKKLMQTDIYKLYASLILRKEEIRMKYKKTEKMDFIFSDETSLVVYDPDSENAYFFDETGIDILKCLDELCTIETILDKLCVIYSATSEEIRPDVEEFLADTITKGIVVAI